MMKKREMAEAIAEKWEKESSLCLGVEYRANDLMKRYSWQRLNDLYNKEIVEA